VDNKALSDAMIWGTGICLLVIGIGVYRAWKAQKRSIALVPIWILLLGRAVVPFIRGYLGLATPSLWLQLADIILATAFSIFLIVRFKASSPGDVGRAV
jgi:hypothetical protein